MLVEIWSDVVCPWCYIGKRRFEAGLALFRESNPDVDVEVVYRAYQLDPSAPLGSGEPVMDAYAKKFGGPEQAQGLIDRVTTEAAGEDLEFRMDIAQRANTQLAHRLLVLARQQGLQIELKERLMDAYFVQGRSLGEVDTLVEIAASAGLDSETARSWLSGDGGINEVVEDLETAAALGISSVPTFVFDRKAAVPGAQPPEVMADVLAQVASLQASTPTS